MRCTECGYRGEMRIEHRDYEYRSLPGTVLRGVENRSCPDCEGESVVIPAMMQLHRLLAGCLVRKPGPLTPNEFRFLRKVLGWSSGDTAKRLGVQPETVSRWEHGQRTIGPTADRAIRLCIVAFEPVEDYSVEALEYSTESTDAGTFVVEVKGRGKTRRWRACA